MPMILIPKKLFQMKYTFYLANDPKQHTSVTPVTNSSETNDPLE